MDASGRRGWWGWLRPMMESDAPEEEKILAGERRRRHITNRGAVVLIIFGIGSCPHRGCWSDPVLNIQIDLTAPVWGSQSATMPPNFASDCRWLKPHRPDGGACRRLDNARLKPQIGEPGRIASIRKANGLWQIQLVEKPRALLIHAVTNDSKAACKMRCVSASQASRKSHMHGQSS